MQCDIGLQLTTKKIGKMQKSVAGTRPTIIEQILTPIFFVFIR